MSVMFPKNSPYRSSKWLAAVGSLEQCVLCGSYGPLQVAHCNEGKSMGMKASDCCSARLCLTCHTEIDNGKHLTRDERRSLMDKAIRITLERLVILGKVTPV